MNIISMPLFFEEWKYLVDWGDRGARAEGLS